MPYIFMKQRDIFFLVLGFVVGSIVGWCVGFFPQLNSHKDHGMKIPHMSHSMMSSKMPHSVSKGSLPFHSEEMLLQKLQQNPNDMQAQIELGNLYYQRNDYNKAIQYYSSIADSNISIALNLAFAYQKQEKYDKALEVYESILQKEPENLGALRYTAKIYEMLGFFTKALACYEKMSTLLPASHHTKILQQKIQDLKLKECNSQE